MLLKRILNNKYTLLGCYSAISIAILFFALSFPMYNLDMLAYVGSTKSFETSDKETIHTFVYSEAKKKVPPEKLYYLLGYASLDQYESRHESSNEPINNSRSIISDDPEALYQQLPFYQIKVLYVSLVYLLSELGINTYLATYLISAISMVLGLWVLLFTFKPYIHNYLLYSIPAFAMAFGLLPTARSSTPDGLAFLMVTIMVYLFTRANWLIFIATPIAVLVRPDLIIFGFMILVYYLIFHKTWRYFSIASILASLILYFSVSYYFGNYGWATLFYHTYIKFLIYPADATIELGLVEILYAYKHEMVKLVFSREFWLYIVIMILSLFLISQNYSTNWYKKRPFNPMIFILISSFLYILIHYLLFPSFLTRFFIGQYLLSVLVFLYLLSNKGHEISPLADKEQHA
ncbi:MAG: hypothetical protein WBB48_04355 [Thermodesulfobacteriota bacterium]